MGIGFPRSVLFVCHGNLCRSPYAAGAFRRLVSPAIAAHVRVDSVGFVGAGRAAPAVAIAAAAARQIDLSMHRSRMLTAQRVEDADVIVVMEPPQGRAVTAGYGPLLAPIIVMGDLDPLRFATRTIHDPIDQPRAVFDAVYDRIDRCLASWVRLWFEGAET